MRAICDAYLPYFAFYENISFREKCKIKLRVLLVEGNVPLGPASMYHGWVPDLHIHAEDTLLPFYLGEKDDLTQQ